jgi:hypothetical protein
MPDVFTLPTAPIRINTRNEWLHGEDLIHPRVASLFCRHIEVQKDGTYAVHLGEGKQGIDVDDTAYWVRHMAVVSGPHNTVEAIDITVSDGRTERVDAASLMQSADNVLYCRIQRGGYSVPCRFSPQQYHVLALDAARDDAGAYLEVGGHKYHLAAYHRAPVRADD